MQASADRWLARVRALRGDTREAVLLLEGALSIGQEGPERFLELSVAPELALLYSAGAQIERAVSLVKHCRRILADGEDWRGLAGRVALADAAVAAAEGRADDADARYAEAIEIFRRCSLPWDEAEALIAWAGAAAQSAHRLSAGRTGDLLDSALALYRRIGAGQPWLDRLLAETERLNLDGGPRTESNPDDLTEREVEVLRLLAAGKSNREIGDELVLSVRTVERHIMNVYAKTGTHTRTRATLYAQEHRLV
jgi:DNA-binding CsgD family transcriptional regulator